MHGGDQERGERSEAARDAQGGAGRGVVAVLAALDRELAPLAALPDAEAPLDRQGLVILRRRIAGIDVVAAVGGVGKVRAARAASLLLAAADEVSGGSPARALLVVGVAGGLVSSLGPGALVHCTRAIQADFAVRDGREHGSSDALRDAWRAAAPGEVGWFLTADRPVLSPWRRLRLRRAFQGPCVADMETAAAAGVAALAGVPWAALRAVSDRAGMLGGAEFRKNFPVQAGRAAATVPALLERLGQGEGLS